MKKMGNMSSSNALRLTRTRDSTLNLTIQSRKSTIFGAQRTNERSMVGVTNPTLNTDTVTPKYAEIFVIRHGETEWNADRRIQGQQDVDLNDAGKKQAFAVAKSLSEEPNISAVYSSDLKRAFVTAEIIATSCSGVFEVIKDPDLRERHLGELEGVLFDEAPKINPEAYKALRAGLNDLEIPGGGESYNQLYTRCTLALQRIANKHKGERVIVVSHGAAIEALFARVLPSEDCHGKVLNASINVFHLSDDDEWSIKSWGDVSHLKP